MTTGFVHRYYYHRLNQAFRFFIGPGNSVLYFGKAIPGIIPHLNTKECIVADDGQGSDTNIVSSKVFRLQSCLGEGEIDEKRFDIIILNCSLGEQSDICKFLKRLIPLCCKSTKIIIYQHNHLWVSILNVAGAMGLKSKEKIQNWLSIGDCKNILCSSGFEPIWSFRQTIFPLKLGGIGPLLNFISDIIPFLDFLKLDQYIISRLTPDRFNTPENNKKLTICITVRDEKENIEDIVISIPQIASWQEILFVEGHSTDGTQEEIMRVQAAYPTKNIRMIGQPDIGQGDAIRAGFMDARGDIIVLYEGDGTSTSEDILFFYEAMSTGRCEFIEGSRFIYPINSQAMPMLNKIGNIFFAKWFSWFLGRPVTDVLAGIKAISKTDFEKIYMSWGFLDKNDPFGDFELLYGAMRYGLKYCEIPIHYNPRQYGQSKTKVFRHGLTLLKMTWSGFRKFRSLKLKEKK